MFDFVPEKGVVLATRDGLYHRIFDYQHPEGGFVAYPLKRKTPAGFVKLEQDLLSGELDFARFACGNVNLPFLSKDRVFQVFTPRESLRARHSDVAEVDKILDVLISIGISEGDIGFDGSNVYGGANSESDLDLLVFGRENRKMLLDNLEQIARSAGLKRYSADSERLVRRREKHLGKLSRRDVDYEISKPVFFKDGKHINITPTFRVDDVFMDVGTANWNLIENVRTTVRILSTENAMQVPALYRVEGLDPKIKVDSSQSNMFYHCLKGKPGEIVEVAGPLVICKNGDRISRRLILSSWGNYLEFRFSFLDG